MNVNAILEAATALAVTVLATPLLIWLCHHWQVLDFPGRLKIHARPIPRLGGVAAALAVAFAAFLRHPLAAKFEWPFFAFVDSFGQAVWLTTFVASPHFPASRLKPSVRFFFGPLAGASLYRSATSQT